MQSSNYTGFKNHQQVHPLLIKQRVKQKEKLFKGKLNCDELIDFFHRWLTEHVVKLGKDFVGYYLIFDSLNKEDY